MSAEQSVGDRPTTAELLMAAATEAVTLAAEARSGTKQRLLVLAHTIALASREVTDAGRADDSGAAAALAAALRAGEHDGELRAILDHLRPEILHRAERHTPGYTS